RAPGNRSGGRVPAISAAVFAGFQSDRTGLQQSEIKAAQGRRAHSQRTLSQNRLDFPLLQNSRMYKFLQACGVRVNVSGICSSIKCKKAPVGSFDIQTASVVALTGRALTILRAKGNGPLGGPFLLVTYRCCSFGRAALWDFYHPCRGPDSAGPVSGRRLVADRASDPALDSAGQVGFGSSCCFLSWEHRDNGSESAPFRKNKSGNSHCRHYVT